MFGWSEMTWQVIIVAFLGALPPTILAWRGLQQGRSNGADIKGATATAAIAAKKASAAEDRVEEVHTTTQAIVEQAGVIQKQTDGQLKVLITQIADLSKQNEQLLQRSEQQVRTINTLANILTATRVAEASAGGQGTVTVPSVRAEDLAQAVQTITDIVHPQPAAPAADERSEPGKGEEGKDQA